MVALDITSEAWNTDDKSWLGHQFGLDTARPVTLDLSLFNATDHYVNGFIPSGVVIGKVTATGRYGPYDPDGVDGRETAAFITLNAARVVRDGNESGTLTLSANAGLWQCIVKESKLPALPDGSGGGEGIPDAGAKAELPNVIWEA